MVACRVTSGDLAEGSNYSPSPHQTSGLKPAHEPVLRALNGQLARAYRDPKARLTRATAPGCMFDARQAMTGARKSGWGLRGL